MAGLSEMKKYKGRVASLVAVMERKHREGIVITKEERNSKGRI